MNCLPIPKPQPDEFSRGHAGRVRVALERRSLEACVAALRRMVSANEADLSFLQLLAMASGLEMEQYAIHHSMLPFSAVGTDSSGTRPGDLWMKTAFRRKGMTSPRLGAYLCPACIEADEVQRRYSYWRRSHQLPGAHTCHEHRLPLQWTASDKAFALQPAIALATSTVCEMAEDEEIRSNATVQRFEAIVGEIVSVDMGAFRHHKFKRVLFNKARARGLSIWTDSRGMTLSDLAVETMPARWLRDLFPEIEAKRTGEFFGPIDNSVNHFRRSTGKSECLAMALLYDRAEDALNELGVSRDYPSSELEQVNRRDKSPRQLFIEKRGDVRAVAADLGISECSTLDELVRDRSQVLKKLAAPAEFRAIRRFAESERLDTACQDEGADLSLANNIIRLLIAKQAGFLLGKE